MSNNILHAKIEGSGKPLIVLHGFLGTGDNWLTFAKAISDHRKVYLIDQRNHGRSFHKDEHTYADLAADIKQFMEENGLKKADFLGHSMGGKTAMQFALTYPESVDHLIVVDIAPKAYEGGHEYILEALQSVKINEVESRKEVEEHLVQKINNKGVVLFLMKNLHRNTNGSYEWKANLEILSEKYDDIISSIDSKEKFDGKTMFLRGSKSDYILDSDFENIRALFPNAEIETVADAGHWIHAEQPEAIYDMISGFLKL